MKQFNLFFSILIAGNLLLLISCGTKDNENSNTKKENPGSVNETALLLDFIQKSGDLINSDQFPFAITADETYEELSGILAIDIRDSIIYSAGHIDGAINLDAKELPVFLEEKINVARYNKVVLVCNSGQSSTYFTTLLRLAGYSNIYSLRFGMAGWSKKITPNKITENLSDKYAGILETKVNTPDKKYEFPLIKTGETGGYGIMLSRIRTLFDEGYDVVRLKIDTLVQHADKYFIVNFWNASDYNKGHLPGSYQFSPKESLKSDKMLAYLPTDKAIAVYCSNGQQSAAATAYLKVLGYNAFNVVYGANGFMHNYMQANLGRSFIPSENIADYEIVEGKNPGLQIAPVASNSNQTAEKEIKTPPVKKKQKTAGGGGC